MTERHPLIIKFHDRAARALADLASCLRPGTKLTLLARSPDIADHQADLFIGDDEDIEAVCETLRTLRERYAPQKAPDLIELLRADLGDLGVSVAGGQPGGNAVENLSPSVGCAGPSGPVGGDNRHEPTDADKLCTGDSTEKPDAKPGPRGDL